MLDKARLQRAFASVLRVACSSTVRRTRIAAPARPAPAVIIAVKSDGGSGVASSKGSSHCRAARQAARKSRESAPINRTREAKGRGTEAALMGFAAMLPDAWRGIECQIGATAVAPACQWRATSAFLLA